MGIRTFKAAVFLKIKMKSECFGERIATPVCALARNDSFFDSLRPAIWRAGDQQFAVLRQRLVQFNPCHAPGRSRTQKKFAVPFRWPLTSLQFT